MKRLPLKYHFVRGRIGKLFVIKRYKGGVVVMTRYPDMTNIIASEKQKIQRRLFKQAVKYAKEIFSNPSKKAEKKKELRRPRRLFQALMKEWFRKKASKDYTNRRRLRIWKTNVELNKGKQTIVGPYAEIGVGKDRSRVRTVIASGAKQSPAPPDCPYAKLAWQEKTVTRYTH
jgi:hypothetical protein